MKKTPKPAATGLLTALYTVLMVLFVSSAFSQTATVTHPFAVGRAGCTSGNHEIHYYNYNSASNTLSNSSLSVCQPLLRYGTTSHTFTSSLSSVSYNPKDQNIYYLYTRMSPLRTFVWKWPAGSCPTVNSPRLDTISSFAYDILGVTFDKNGNGYMLEFSLTGPPYTALLRSIDFTTGTYGQADTLDLTGGAKIYSTGTGDIAMSPSGQMYFVVDNKLFTPDYTNYGGAAKKITCTYIDTVRSPGGSLVGLTFAQGELLAAYSGGSSCRFREIAPMTGDTSLINSTATSRSTSDFASVISGIGASKNIVSVTPTGVANQFDVVYDIYIRNYGNYPVSNVQVTDALSAINGASNVSVLGVNFMDNPAGLALNPSFNGNSNQNLLSGSVALPNYPATQSFARIRISVRLSGILQGRVYNNQAFATGTGFAGVALRDASTNGTSPDLNSNDKPDDAGEDQPTPLLIAVSSYTPPCASLGTILYSETFGTGAVTTNINASTNSASTQYTGSTSNPLPVDAFKIGNNSSLGNTSQWASIADHTTGTGRMLMVNADANNLVFFRDTLPVVCANQQYSINFYAAFPGNSNYQTVCNAFGGFKYPRVLIRIRDAASGLVVTQNTTEEITSNSWNQYGLKFVLPTGFSSLIFELINDAQGGCGNDILIDDIQFGLCDAIPVVSVTAPEAGCIGAATSMTAALADPLVIPGTKEYQWQVSGDGVTWTNISGATSATYTINSVAASDLGKYYRALVAAQGNIGSANCRYPSSAFQLSAKATSIAPTSASTNRQNICPADAVTLRVNGGTLGTNANWRWYSSSCGGTSIGSGNSITVNPNATTTYFVRAEGDCNVTSCVSITITVNCDIDDDDDGITDLAESNNEDPSMDDDFDGIENYRDTDFAGFTDSNNDGIHDGYDNDLDGIINSLDRDSDNDGIPDVVESGGVDENGDGIIDNYIDTDNDGLSQNVDANNTGSDGSGTGLGLVDLDADGVPNIFDLDSDNDGLPDVYEAKGVDANNDGRIDVMSSSLIRTGADVNNDGRADSYPYKNFDRTGPADAYDLDSDDDGITDVREAGFIDANSNGMIDGAIAINGWSVTVSSLATLTVRNTDGDALPNHTDIDSDGDGIPDNIEGMATASYWLPLYADDDNDGIDNRYDNQVGFGGNGITPNDQDNDSLPDYIDTDSDGDSASDAVEANDFNNNCDDDDLVLPTGIDTDGDGLDDRFDADNTSHKGTSLYMGNLGMMMGDTSPGSLTHVNMCNASGYERDFRYLAYVLEVNFHNIMATRKSAGNNIQWIVSCDKIINHFIVQRSSDGVNYKEIAKVKTQASILNGASFEYTDNDHQGSNAYYRVVAVDNHQQQRTSRSVTLRASSNTTIVVYPNPSSQQVYVALSIKERQHVSVRLTDVYGNTITRNQRTVAPGSMVIGVTNGKILAKGTYFVEVITGDERKLEKVVIR